VTALLPRLARPDARTAVTVADVRLSYADLARACAGHAAFLQRLGVRAGDRVAVWAQPSLSTVVALVGNALAGVVSVPLNPKVGARELEHIVGDASPAAVLAGDPGSVPAAVPGLEVRRLEAAPADAEGVPSGAGADDTPLLILYTSGTTGPPKGAVITAGNVAANLDALARAWAWTERDTVVHALPLFHVHGLVLGLLGSLRVGGALAWVPRFDPATVAARLAGEGTMLFAVPTMVHRLAESAERDGDVARALAGARLLVSGSAALPVREHTRIGRVTGRPVHERYGLTETLIVCAARADAPVHPGTVGPPLDGMEVRVVGDDGADLPQDGACMGEILVRGPSVFPGYLNRPDATAAVLDADGWFHTGDLAVRSADGAVRIVGRRATDLIKTGGFKVGAGEVEAALLEHPQVREVAVLGVPDADLGERIVAFVVPTDPASPPAAQALADGVAEALAPHKRPREVRFVAGLPRNAMGKVQKGALRRERTEGG
jgi:malonyl-CoA/methylmalonyl-CoA synthetase